MKIRLFAGVVLVGPLFAQTPVVTGAGYAAPGPVRVAPGQVITLFVRTASAPPLEAITSSRTSVPTEVAGLSVLLQQTFSDRTVPAPILSVAPVRTCSAVTSPATCNVRAAITIQVPLELVPNTPGSRQPENFATLTVVDNGLPGESVALDAVPSNPHVINTCDTTQAQQPDGICVAAVRHADGTLVTAEKPAQRNELLTVDLVGLGNPGGDAKTGVIPAAAIAAGDVSIALEFGTNRSAVTLAPEADKIAAGLSTVDVGVYRIAFRVPDVPADITLCTGSRIRSNLTITIGRTAAASDHAGFCVEPPK